LRFVLDDAKQRRFVCERYCFLGSIDDWIFIGGSEPLADLVRTFMPHLSWFTVNWTNGLFESVTTEPCPRPCPQRPFHPLFHPVARCAH
jgi:hypothetical protein